MKKCLFALVVPLTMTLMSTANASAAQKPSFGILGGLHLANIAIHPDPADANLAFVNRSNIGGLVELGLSPNASLQARCMYVPKGADLEDLEEDIDLSATTYIDYVTVPVLLKIQANAAKIRPYAVVGPEIGFKVRAGASLSTTASVSEDILSAAEKELSDQVDDQSKSIDVALEFGGGIEIPTGRLSILVEGIYSLGLRNIAVPPEGEDGSAKTKTFLFSAGVRF